METSFGTAASGRDGSSRFSNRNVLAGKTSISAQHHTRNSGGPLQLRNVAVINAAKQLKADPEASRKREELNKRIEETRRKLQSVGYRSSLKSSQSITDLHVPERDSWHAPNRIQSAGIAGSNVLTNLTRDVLTHPSSVPSDLQLCGCFMRDIENACGSMRRPKRLALPEKRYKLHKSLPVSPVSEECRFSDFVQAVEPRRSFSYFVDLSSTEEGLLKVCSDIEKFSQTHNYDEYDVKDGDDDGDDDDGNFSSDSLEECSFTSTRVRKKKYSMPRRCYSNNEIYNYEDDFVEAIPTSKSFYLNPSARGSQDSILSDCNSLESVLSDESESRSAPLEALFVGKKRKPVSASGSPYRQPSTSRIECGSLPNDVADRPDLARSKSLGNTKENTNPVVKVVKSNTSYDFQQKLLRFETGAVADPLRENKKSIAFFIETPKSAYFVETARRKFERNNMEIPSLKSKNIQYSSKYRNVLNNKPEGKPPDVLFSEGRPRELKLLPVAAVESAAPERQLETTSLDRHILHKPPWETEKVVHKPPKPVRRHSSKTFRNRPRKVQNNFSPIERPSKSVNFDRNVTNEQVFEVSYKEKNREVECESGPKTILADIYDSLDKLITDTERPSDENLWGKSPSVIELERKNIWKRNSLDKLKPKLRLSESDLGRIQTSIENIKLLHEIQQKIHKINTLVDTFKANITHGKVKILSRMYETLSRSQVGLNNIAGTPLRTKRNMSLPNFLYRKPPNIAHDPPRAVEKLRGFELLPSKGEGDLMLDIEHGRCRFSFVFFRCD